MGDQAGVAEVPRIDADIASRIVHMGPGCWIWQGRLDVKGYGRKGERLAHRVVYEALVGSIPEGLTIDHLCRNRACVNPNHLEPVTGRVNTLRGSSFSAANARKTHCDNGHPLSGENLALEAGARRRCRTCQRANVARYKRRLRTKAVTQ